MRNNHYKRYIEILKNSVSQLVIEQLILLESGDFEDEYKSQHYQFLSEQLDLLTAYKSDN